MSTPLVVNLAALTQLASQLSLIRDAMAASPPGASTDGGALGSATLAHEFERFASEWSQGRSRIDQELVAITKIVQFAATAYSHADSAVATATGTPNS